MLHLKCCSQNYAWGRPGHSSEVASLCEANGDDVDKTKPYAELWMGTHPSGPSKTMGSSTLKEWIDAHSECLGARGIERFGKVLPFLFKVLSVQTALSIQSHPDKRLAEKLHSDRPNVYKDPNHKPEMAIALHDFQALCSFVTHDKLVEVVKENPELRACIGDEESDALLGKMEDKKQALKDAFTKLMTCSEAVYGEAVSKLVDRLEKESKSRELSAKENLVIQLNEQYPKDVGVLAAFFLNLVKLNPGQAIYLPANEPHAYVSGELVECMAASDNVIRAGLTPKLRDTEVLCSSLTYTQGLPQVLEGDSIDTYVKSYSPPFDEFEVQAINVPKGTSAKLPVNQGPMVLLVQSGRASLSAKGPISSPDLKSQMNVNRGNVLFIPANTAIEVTTTDEPLASWAGCVNCSVVDPGSKINQGRSNIVQFPLQARTEQVQNVG